MIRRVWVNDFLRILNGSGQIKKVLQILNSLPIIKDDYRPGELLLSLTFKNCSGPVSYVLEVEMPLSDDPGVIV